MAGPQNETDPSQNGTKGPVSDASGDAEPMSHDWLARLRESDSGWNQPAFPERQSAPRMNPAKPESATNIEPAVAGQTVNIAPSSYPAWRVAGVLLLLVSAAIWIGAVLASVFSPAVAAKLAPAINLMAILSGPLILIGGLAYLLLGGRKRSRDRRTGRRSGDDAQALSAQAAHAVARLGDAHAQLMNNTRDFASLTDQSAAAILGSVQSMAHQTSQLEQNTARSIDTLSMLGERITGMTEALPRLEDRLATLAETLARVGGDLGQRHDRLDEQLQATALIAEEARLQLGDAGTLLAEKLGALRNGARAAGEELAGLSELSSARIELTLDRVQTVVDATQEQIEAQNKALVDLVETSRAGIDATSGISLERFSEHCRKVEAILEGLDKRIVSQADKSSAWLEATARGVTALASEFNVLEKSATERTEALASTISRLVEDTRNLTAAITDGQGGTDLLIKRAESLLVALDSGVRELDESIPEAIGRVEAQMATLSERIRSTNPEIEAVEAAAKGVVSQLRESDQLAAEQIAALTAALDNSHKALTAQKEKVEALADAVAQAGNGMAQLGDHVGPRLVEALASVRATADAAAEKARTAINDVIPQAAARLADAGGAALQEAVAKGVSDQLERLSLVADDAVKAAHRATDKLTRQMLSLTDASQALDKTINSNAERIESQDRDLMAQRSARLIAALNERAIDVNKWLDRDVSEAEWTSYLKGDQGIFARRATRLVSSGEARHVHSLYNEDPDFREHVNRYVHDFEALLRTVMASRDGSTLALTMISSDIGKLYVALAQAIERLRSH